MIPSTSAAGSTEVGTASAATAVSSEAPTTEFDAILSLEAFAAVVSACPEGMFAEESGEDLPLDTDEDREEAETLDAAAPLAFLASLLALPATPTQPLAGGAGASSEDVGADPGAGSPSRPTVAMLPPPPAVPVAATPDGGATPTDIASADKLMTALDAGGSDVSLDAAPRSDPTSQAPLRGAEWFGQALRHAEAPIRNAIVTHARDPRWAEEFGARIALMVRGGESAASLQLSPADLGPLEVSITVRDSQASVHFGAAQAETRNLIESSIPRLREMLESQGFQLMDASVSQGFARQARSDVPPAQRRDGEPEAEVQTTRVTATGLLDTYA